MLEEIQHSAPDTQPKRLKRPARGIPVRGPTLLALNAILTGLIGIVFAAIGTIVVLLSLDFIKVNSPSMPSPRWPICVWGAILGVTGLAGLANGVSAARRVARKRRLSRLCPLEPWLADFTWDPTGLTTRVRSDVSCRLCGELFAVPFVFPFWYSSFYTGGSIFGRVISLGFELAALAVVIHAGFLLLRWLKYGDSRLQFDRFPFFLGEVLAATLIPDKGIRGCRRVTFTLRCIQEPIEASGGQEDSEACYQIWASTFEVAQPGDMVAGRPIPVTFLLPDDPALGTALADRPPRYWEVEVAAATPGIAYKARFLVPVYVRPAGAAT
jgi:hypothetical protein